MSIHFSNDLDALRDSRPASMVVSRRTGFYRHFGKHFMDTVLVLLSAILIVPLVAVLAAVIALDGGNPFYKQKRVGRNGRVFTIWKLRTMVPDADARLADYLTLNPEARAEWENTQNQESLYPGTSYFALRPGITGLWQISERNHTSFSERAMYDNRYESSLSMALDVAILFKTVRAVARCTGY